MKLNIIFFSLIFVFNQCSNVHKADKTTTTNNPISEKNNTLSEKSGDKKATETSETASKNISDVLIGFISIGAGTNTVARRQLENFITEFEKTNSVIIKFNKITYGREGETDYCFDLSALKPDLKKMFISKSKELLNKSENVNYQENKSCRNKL